MADRKDTTSDIQKTITENLQRYTRMSIDTFKPLIESMYDNFSNMGNTLSNARETISRGEIPRFNLSRLNTSNNNCSVPDEECPPHCISSISRFGMVGERILVPFSISNTHSNTRTYQVGVRELTDQDGGIAPKQPTLNKTTVTLTPGQSERVIMTIDLDGFENGSKYTAEIVLREKEINQNICFTLRTSDYLQITVRPYDEKKQKQKWQSWQSHFYCDTNSKGDEEDGGLVDSSGGTDKAKTRTVKKVSTPKTKAIKSSLKK